MKRARIAFEGREQWVTIDSQDLVYNCHGVEIDPAEFVWLPPVSPGVTAFALGLNYTDHSSELGFKPPSTPLIFLKGYNTFAGHGGIAPMPRDARQMHPECELVAVVGKTARRVSASEAHEHIGGYTIANDLAIRDYLENYYRPNLRVKNRDATTPLGPWIVDACDLPDPQSLAIETRVNGESVQTASTADMIFSVASLVEYISEFMTLLPGDLILTGTPSGVRFVKPGDEIVCSIEGIGALATTIRAGP